MDFPSPAPFVNTRYQIRGGLDTPGVAAANAQEAAESEYCDSGFRKDLGGGVRSEDSSFSFFPRIDTPPSAKNGSRQYTPSPKRDGWSKAAFDVAGAVVGKVWQFTTAPFRGFIAGGGTAYTESAHPMTPAQENFWREDYASQDRTSTPIPGQFPEEDFIPNYMDDLTSGNDREANERPSKRRQVSGSKPLTANGDLEKNWIMVQDEDEFGNATHQPQRAKLTVINNRASLNPRVTTRPTSRASNISMHRSMAPRYSTASLSHAGSPNLTSRTSASFASPRSSPGGSRIPIPSYQSVSPSKIPRMSLGVRPESPAAKDVSRFAARRKMEEREFDEATRKFNKQLRDMIKEGKEALGTRVEVVDSEEEGFEDAY